MKYYTIQPSIHLKPYVRCFWVLEHELSAGEQSYVYRSIADGCVEMVFHYRATFDELITSGQPHNWLSGIHFQSNHYRRFETRQSFGIFGAYIYPFATPYFFKIPSEETSNKMLDLDIFLGRSEGKELEEQIMLAPDNFKRTEILTAFLEARLTNRLLQHNNIVCAIKHVIHSKQIDSVAQLADKFNLSVRQFDRKFKEYAGFSPKTYLRLVRLNKATQQHRSNKPLTQIALECGYYDQSHFIHDVKAFTGYHPSFYFSGQAEGTEYKYV
jgi:AraC-like DNA-binding protein